MVPLSALMNVKPSAGPERAMRYNGFLAADINGRPAPGFSSGQAQDAIERIAAQTLPAGIGFEWTELTYQEIIAGNSAVWVFPLSILLVFLVLAALYESRTMPVAIILIVPMGLLAGVDGRVAIAWRQQRLHADRADHADRAGGEERDPHRRVRAELEFAGRTPRASRAGGEPPPSAADPDDVVCVHHGQRAARLRSRRRLPERQALGTAVVFGMIGVTAFGVFFIPVFYVVLRMLTRNRPLKQHGEVPHIEAFATSVAGGGARAGVPAAPADSNQP